MVKIAKGITKEMVQGIMADEDPWIRTFGDPCNPALSELRDSIKGQGGLLKSIEIIERNMGKKEYHGSPALHCLLGHFYIAVGKTIDYGTKYAFELLKLDETGEKEIINYIKTPVPQIPADLREKVSIVRAYLEMGNKARSIHHLEGALNMSGSHNPTVFHKIIEPITWDYMQRGFDLIDSYNQAKRRVEGISGIRVDINI